MKAKKKKKEIPFTYSIDYRYDVVNGITPAVATIWQVELLTGFVKETRFMFWHKDAKVEDIHRYLSARWQKFRFRNVANGDVTIDVLRPNGSGINDLYCSDSRWVDQDWKVSIE